MGNDPLIEFLDGFLGSKFFRKAEKIGYQKSANENRQEIDGCRQLGRNQFIDHEQAQIQYLLLHKKILVLENDQPDEAKNQDPEYDFEFFHRFSPWPLACLDVGIRFGFAFSDLPAKKLVHTRSGRPT
jgi:hypothetical protein